VADRQDDAVMATPALDPAAATAASLLAGKTLADQSGPATPVAEVGGLGEVAGLLQQAAATNPDVQATLGEVAAHPEDPAVVAALAQLLAVLATRDGGIRAGLGRLAAAAAQHPTLGGVATTIADQAQVGKVVTIGQAGTVQIHPAPQLPPTVLERLGRVARHGPLVANLPPRNPSFSGRQDLLGQLHASLLPGQAAAVVQPQALHGLGGVGKTQLVLEYAYRHLADYDLVWWVTAEQPAAIPGQLVALARRLGIPEAVQQAETVQVLWDELRQRERWLLILDNAEGPDTPTGLQAPLERLADLLPRVTGGQVLVTSRDASWDQHATLTDLEVFRPHEAVAFLLTRSGSDDQATAAEIAGLLGRLPLALEQAGAYVRETRIPLAAYLDRLRRSPARALAKGRPRDRRPTDTVATTWQVSLERIAPTLGAVALLELCAFLDSDTIPRQLFAQQLEPPVEELAVLAGDPFALDEAVAALRRYALVDASEDAVTVHRLVQQVIRDRLDPMARAARATGAVRLLYAAFPREGYRDPGVWPSCEQLLSHAISASGHAEQVAREHAGQGKAAAARAGRAATAWLLTWASGYLYGRARYLDAQGLLARALALKDAVDGADQPDALIVSYLGLVSQAQGDLDQARTHFERALATYESNYGPDHPDVATTLNNLAIVLRTQGDLAGARPLLERALAIREARLGPDHPDTAQSLNSLAESLRVQGDLDSARPLHERALHINEARLGPDHPDTAQSLNNLATVLYAQGDLAGARALNERALHIYEARLGRDHPITANSLNNLANVLHGQGDLDSARRMHERALEIRETRLGPDHPHIALSLNNLATVLHGQGDLAGARALHERALQIRETRLGADHPDTVRSRRDLAAVVAALENRG
jgi:tetratricopeptide (TPR) repeat protein